MYIAEAFVKITCPHKRHEVMCKINLSDRDMLLGQFFQMERTRLGVSPNSVIFYPNHEKIDEDVIDCNLYANGDEDLAVKLFLSLAEMDSDNTDTLYYETYTVISNGKGGYEAQKCSLLRKGKITDSMRAGIGTINALTPRKFAEAVRDGKIKLKTNRLWHFSRYHNTNLKP